MNRQSRLYRFVRCMVTIPLLGALIERTYLWIQALVVEFPGSEEYWLRRYQAGGDSGAGSVSLLAEYKANIINGFVKDQQVVSLIEFGCGDGQQLSLAEYPAYIGYDISPVALERCRALFEGDDTKTFKLLSQYNGELADASLSIDVIYHLVEDSAFNLHMQMLFVSAERFVVIYSSNTDVNGDPQARHIRHRTFTDWIAVNRPDWRLLHHIRNRHRPPGMRQTATFAEFYFFGKSEAPSSEGNNPKGLLHA